MQANSENNIPIDDIFRWIEELNQIGASLSSEQNISVLLEAILLSAMSIANADGGTLYRVVDGKWIKFETLRTESLGIAMGGTTGKEITFPLIPLYQDGMPNDSLVVASAVLKDCTINIRDVYEAEGFDFSGTRKFDEKTGYRSKSFLTVPMKNHEQEIIGVLQLINAKDRKTGEIVGFSAVDQNFAESLASQAAIALTNRQLILQLEELFESFIKVINYAIERKSDYTGKHLERVPELTMMLAEAANNADEGPLKDFRMTERDRMELRIAGLLHDCGKIVTPVHVVDKSTKLETIFDRIHTVEAKFGSLRRDAEIAYLKGVMASPQKQMELEEAYRKTLVQLDDDLAFLQKCNVGGEFMNDADIGRVKDMAVRYQVDGKNLLTEEEIDNLTIRRGTLNAEERQIINDHIKVTIEMLEALPWPNRLKNVTEYAGGHHEKMDGTGYPKGLKREDMSIQARMMGIADIFEALTACDRPYKKGKTLTESLNILGKFCLDNHIDPDLFDLFVRRKVYLQYAKEFMKPEQIDEVDHSKIPGYAM
jgi:HD-GYP domain-containing protein (c-di-GMP phosphodiesterase class II)